MSLEQRGSVQRNETSRSAKELLCRCGLTLSTIYACCISAMQDGQMFLPLKWMISSA